MKCQHSWEEVGRLSEQINTDSYSSLPSTKLLRSLWNGQIYIIRICSKCFELQYKKLGSSWEPFGKDQAKRFLGNRNNNLILSLIIPLVADGKFIKEWPPTIELHHDIRKRLHCEDGPAVIWKDHITRYYWHGIQIPSIWIINKDEIDIRDFLNERNTELRKGLYEILGNERVLRMLNATLIDDKDCPERFPKLYEAFDPVLMTFRMVQVKEPGTGDIYCHFVSTDCKTAKEAVASLWNLRESEFHPENLSLER